VQFVCLLGSTLRMRPTMLMAVENDHGHLKTAYLTGGEGGLGLGQLSGITGISGTTEGNEVMLSDALEPFADVAAPTPDLEHIYPRTQRPTAAPPSTGCWPRGTRILPQEHQCQERGNSCIEQAAVQTVERDVCRD
jgi:hypothetical protein